MPLPLLLGAGGLGALGAAGASAAALGTIPVIGGALGAAGAAGAWSHLGSGAMSLAGGLYGNYASARQARINREFQASMSGTSHQREVEDLRLAGLNPILSVHGGASTPGGATASQWDVGTPAVSSALAARINKAQVNQLSEAVRLTREQGNTQVQQQRGIEAQIKLANANEATARAQKVKTDEEAYLTKMQGKLANYSAQSGALRLPGDLDAARFWSGPEWSAKRRADALSETIRGYTGALPSVRGLLFGGSKPGLKAPRGTGRGRDGPKFYEGVIR